MKLMYQLEKTVEIDSAHFLPNYEGKCHQLHGHRWKVVIRIGSDKLNEQGMVIDFTKIKEVVNTFDHACLNDFIEQPTAENLGADILRRMRNICGKEVFIEVDVYETPDSKLTVMEKIGE